MGHDALSDYQWFTPPSADLPYASPLVPTSRRQNGAFLSIPSVLPWANLPYTYSRFKRKELLLPIKGCEDVVSGSPKGSKIALTEV